MINSKLIEILTSLSKDEFYKLGLFLHSAYFNQSNTLNKLFLFLYRNYLKSRLDKLSDKEIFKSLYKNESFKQQKIALLLSDFLKEVERFLVVQEFKVNNIEFDKTLIKVFKKRNTLKNYNYHLKKYYKNLSNNKLRDEEYYSSIIGAEESYKLRDFEKIFFTRKNIYQSLIDNIDHFYILKKMKIIIDALNHRNEINPTDIYKFWLLDDILKYVKTNLVYVKKHEPLIYTYYLILLSKIQTDNINTYNKLKTYIKSHDSNYTDDELYKIYLEIRIYLINKIGTNEKSKYLKDLFYIYTIEEERFYSKERSIADADFVGYILIGLQLKKLMTVKNFYSRYKDRLNPVSKVDTLNLMLALILFQEREYDKSLEHVNKVSYRNFNYYIRVKVLMIKLYYELCKFDAISYEIDALNHYLSRNKNKITKYFPAVSKFIKYTKVLIKVDSLDNLQRRQYYKQLLNEKFVFSAKWVEEKFQEIL